MYMYMYFGSMYFDKIRRGKWRGGGRGVTNFTSMKRSGIFGERMYTRYGCFARIRSKLESPSIGGSSERVSGVFPIAAPAAIV